MSTERTDWDERLLASLETRTATRAIVAVLGVAAVWLGGVIVMTVIR